MFSYFCIASSTHAIEFICLEVKPPIKACLYKLLNSILFFGVLLYVCCWIGNFSCIIVNIALYQFCPPCKKKKKKTLY